MQKHITILIYSTYDPSQGTRGKIWIWTKQEGNQAPTGQEKGKNKTKQNKIKGLTSIRRIEVQMIEKYMYTF